MTAHQDDQILVKFEEVLSHAALSASTIVNYLADLRAFRRWIAEEVSDHFLLLNTRQEHIRLYRHHLSHTLQRATATVNRHMMSLRKFFAFAVEFGYMPVDPTAGVALVSDDTVPDIRLLSEAETKKLIAAAQNGARAGLVKRDVAILQTLLHTGIQVNELVDLQKDDLIFDNPGIRLRIGAGHDRSQARDIPVPGELCTALVDYLQFRPASSITNFFLSQEGRSISRRTVQRVVSDCAKAAGLDGVSAQCLRRTFARQLYAKTQDLALVARRLGHQNISTTEQYLSINPGAAQVSGTWDARHKL